MVVPLCSRVPEASVFHVHDKFVFLCDVCDPKNHCAPNIPVISFTVKIICPFSYLRHQIRQHIALWDYGTSGCIVIVARSVNASHYGTSGCIVIIARNIEETSMKLSSLSTLRMNSLWCHRWLNYNSMHHLRPSTPDQPS